MRSNLLRMLSITILLTLQSLLTFSQERAWISEQSSIILRNDMEGFEKVNDSTWMMQGWNIPCENSSGNVIVEGIATFQSMACFREYLLSQPNKIISWGRLQFSAGTDTVKINNWETDKIQYTGNWAGAMKNSSPGTGCKCSFSNTLGDRAELTFTGTGIQVWGERNPHENTADIYIDNQKVATVNEYQATEGGNEQILLYEADNLNYDTHTIRIVITGEDERASNTYFVLHKFQVLNEDVSIPPVNPCDEDPCEPEIIYVPEVHVDTVYIQSPPEIIYDTVYVAADTIEIQIDHYFLPEYNLIQGEIIQTWKLIESYE